MDRIHRFTDAADGTPPTASAYYLLANFQTETPD
jgi:hypothetical protein